MSNLTIDHDSDSRAVLRELLVQYGNPNAIEKFMSAENRLIERASSDDKFMESYPFVKSDAGDELFIYGRLVPESTRSPSTPERLSTEVSSISVARALDNFKGDELTVRFNCPGGSTREGSAIASRLTDLRLRGVTVNAVVDGLSGSASIWPMLACDTIKGFAVSEYLVHRSLGVVMGNAHALRILADNLEKIDEAAFAFEGRRVKGGADKLRELADANNGAGTWLNAEEAAEIGLIDEVVNMEPPTEKADEKEGAARSVSEEEGVNVDLELEDPAKVAEIPEGDDVEGWKLAAQFKLKDSEFGDLR